MAAPSRQAENGAKWTVSTEGWPTENWVAVVVIGALALLILIRMGFRGVSFGGASINVG